MTARWFHQDQTECFDIDHCKVPTAKHEIKNDHEILWTHSDGSECFDVASCRLVWHSRNDKDGYRSYRFKPNCNLPTIQIGGTISQPSFPTERHVLTSKGGHCSYEKETPMAKQFQIGDVIRLKSGGPDMTVTRLYPVKFEDHVECTWFVDGKKDCAQLPIGALDAVPQIHFDWSKPKSVQFSGNTVE
jgi:uncharacterized protein YodC (DUF2158 family)